MSDFFHFILGHRKLTISLVLLITTLLGIFTFRLEIDNSFEVWFPENNPELILYEKFTEWDIYGVDIYRVGPC